jgi:hypothetical protein
VDNVGKRVVNIKKAQRQKGFCGYCDENFSENPANHFEILQPQTN